MEHAETLRTLAEVATAFAGFTGIVVALGRRSDRKWSAAEALALRVLIQTSLGSVLFAFFPLLIGAAIHDATSAWRVSIGTLAAYSSVIFVLDWVRQHRGAPILVSAQVVLVSRFVGAALILMDFLFAVGLWPALIYFGYLLSLMYLLSAAALMFALLLMNPEPDR